MFSWKSNSRGGGGTGSPGVGRPTLSNLLVVAPFALTPAKFKNMFNIPEAQKLGNDGAGETIAFVEKNSIFDYAAFQRFCRKFDLPMTHPTIIDKGAAKPVATKPLTKLKDGNNQSGEVMMDVEWAHVIAPKAKLVLIDLTSNSIHQIQDAISKYHIDVISSSVVSNHVVHIPLVNYSVPGGLYYYLTIGSQVPFFQGSGDKSAWTVPNMVSSSTVIVGGMGMDPYLKKPYVWPSEGYGAATWLAHSTALQQQAAHKDFFWRRSPDMVWLATLPFVAELTDHGWIANGGTSLSTPLTAALWSLGDAAHVQKTGNHLPTNANATIYRLYKDYPNAFQKPSSQGQAGWTPKWGLGYPNPSAFVRGLADMTNSNVKYSYLTKIDWAQMPIYALAVVFALWIGLLFRGALTVQRIKRFIALVVAYLTGLTLAFNILSISSTIRGLVLFGVLVICVFVVWGILNFNYKKTLWHRAKVLEEKIKILVDKNDKTANEGSGNVES